MPLLQKIERAAFSRLSALSQVPRVLDPTPDVFNRYFVDRGAPMIGVGGKVFRDGLPTLDELVQRAGGRVRVKVRGGNYMDVQGREQRDMTFAEYVERYLASPPPSARSDALPDYAGNSPLTREDMDVLGLKYPDFFEHKSFDAPRLWMGPAGSLTPLHYDSRDNVICQYVGRKRITLYPPSEIPRLYTRGFSPSWSGVPDPRRPDLARFPRFAQAKAVELTLVAGEILYLPEGWSHFVVNVATSVMVNFWPERTALQKVKMRAIDYRWRLQKLIRTRRAAAS